MPSALLIPGVQVQTRFEPAPALPGATGILGVVGVADRGPADPTPIGQFGEFLELFGPGSRYTMPEVRTAFANGVSRVFVARVPAGRGRKATLVLQDEEGENVVKLEARAEGAWGNRIGVRVTPVRTLSGEGVKYVNLEVSLDGDVVDVLNNLILDPASPDDLFTRINDGSRILVAFDPLFEKGLPSPVTNAALTDAGPRAAFAVLRRGATDVVRVEAKRAGAAGNRFSVNLTDGRAALDLAGPGDVPSVRIEAREAGPEGTGIRVTVQSAGPGAETLVITESSVPPRTIGPFSSVADLAAALSADPRVSAMALGEPLPTPAAAARLQRRVDVTVIPEGRDPRRYEGLASIEDVATVSDSLVAFSAIGAPTGLPDADEGQPLRAGRDQGPALELVGESAEEPLLELVPAPGVTAALAVTVAQAISSLDGSTAVVNLSVTADGEVGETLTDLTMDPDDPRYLPDVLEAAAFVRAHDLFVRSRATSLPRRLSRPVLLTGGASPSVDDYQEALDRLESAEEVDLVIASVGNQLGDEGVRGVHQAVAAHCAKMADVARNRIGLGSVTASESGVVPAVLDHADDVRSDHFVLTAPVGTEAALAGVLGLQNYFESATFKTVPSLGVPPGAYTDAQLIGLIQGNVAVINERRGRGIIVVKAVLTSGRQISVQRTANKAVRDTKAISERFIGLLNNEGDRNALKQHITAMLLQMERDGAIVPSTDGKDPAFTADVYSSQNDFALGIVRVDIAVRPVRAIDYIYATILVKN